MLLVTDRRHRDREFLWRLFLLIDIPMTTSHISRAALLFCLQFFGYLLVTLNIRAVADVNYTLTFATDILIAVIGFSSIKQIAYATTRLEQVAYAVGGALGAQAALWISLRYFPS